MVQHCYAFIGGGFKMIDEKNGEVLKIRVTVKGVGDRVYPYYYRNLTKMRCRTRTGIPVEVEVDPILNPNTVQNFVASLDNAEISELRRQMIERSKKQPRYQPTKGRAVDNNISPRVYNFVTTDDNGEKKKTTEGKEQK